MAHAENSPETKSTSENHAATEASKNWPGAMAKKGSICR